MVQKFDLATEWQRVKDAPRGHVFEDYYEDGVRVLIRKGGSSLCAYVGVPASHPLAGFDYDKVPIRCHGGLTFAAEGRNEWPEGYYWYGWDYSHSGDYATYYDDANERYWEDNAKKWTVPEVKQECWSVAYDFAQLMRLAEELTARALEWRGKRDFGNP